MKFQSFNSYDEMMEALNNEIQRANEKVFSFQRVIKPGDFCVMPTEYGFPVFIEVLEFPEDYPAEEKNAPTWQFLFTRSYSEACPEGEYGDQHRAVLLPIPQEHFEAARCSGWDQDLCSQIFALALTRHWPEISAARKQ